MKQNTKLEVSRIKAGQPSKVGVLVEVTAPTLQETGQARSPQAIIFVVDRSGSMGDGRLELVKNTIGELVGRLSPTDYLAVVSFDTELETHVPIQLVGTTNAQKLRRELANLEPRGGTNIELGFVAGLQEAAKAPDGIERRVILLSDGQANDGVIDPISLGQIAAFATEHLVKTSTIGIGEGYDERILASIANAGQGNHFAAVVLEEAIAGMQNEIDSLLQRSLAELSCTVEIVDQHKGVWVHPLGYVKSKKGFPGGLTVDLNDMASGEVRGFAFVLDIDAIQDLETLKVQTTVRGTAIESGDQVASTQSVTLEISEPIGFVVPVRDEDVVAEILAYRLTDVKALAAQAAMKGDFEEAKRLIRQAQGDTKHLMDNLDALSPRLRTRLMSEHKELSDLLTESQLSFSKRAMESSFRSARSQVDPRSKK